MSRCFSFLLHKWKWKSIRIISDCCCVSAFMVLLFDVISYWHPSHITLNVLCAGVGNFFLAVVYYCDSIIFINRYLAVYPKTSNLVRGFFYTFLAAQFVLWAPEVILLPFWIDCTAQKVREKIVLGICISVVMKTLFNAFFSVIFFRMMQHYLHSSEEEQKNKHNYTVFVISLKSILHFLTSVVAVLLNGIFLNTVAWRVCAFIIPNQIHFLFNYNIEANSLVVYCIRYLFCRSRKIMPGEYQIMDLDPFIDLKVLNSDVPVHFPSDSNRNYYSSAVLLSQKDDESKSVERSLDFEVSIAEPEQHQAFITPAATLFASSHSEREDSEVTVTYDNAPLFG